MKAGSQICYLGLGSNVGNKFRQLNQAIEHIDRLRHTRFIESAPWYESAAWGVKDQADFLNTVIKISTQLKPLTLLSELKKIEYRLMLRKPKMKWHSRNIDIDILLYGNQVINKPQLKIPHYFLTERCFVIAPLMYFKPELNALTKKNITQHLFNHKCSESLFLTQSRLNGIKKQ